MRNTKNLTKLTSSDINLVGGGSACVCFAEPDQTHFIRATGMLDPEHCLVYCSVQGERSWLFVYNGAQMVKGECMSDAEVVAVAKTFQAQQKIEL